ncbi:hypothetical protein [Lactococcus cremoris]|uniref:hypothetical protein n=1 Tax=Lactococcus lactis subsp. cremoris TaxID=1359 RepID=UPI0024A643BC|nr:hypothetical protein [Lactococcus cremoris]MBS5601508.1 hypothetical protein [Lactococcus lactis]
MTSLYNTFSPNKVKYRKNIHLAKQLYTIAKPRKNVIENRIDHCLIKAIKKIVGMAISGIQSFRIERLIIRQLPSIITRIQLIVLLYNLLEVEVHCNETERMTFKLCW